MENRTALWQQIPKQEERTASNSERRHHDACGPSEFTVKLVHADWPHLGQTGGLRPVRFRGESLRKLPFVRPLDLTATKLTKPGLLPEREEAEEKTPI